MANGTVSTSWINILGENASSGASGQLTQDSVLTSNSIVSSSSARFSAQFNNTGLSDRARAQGWSEGTLFFSLDQYCRFTLSGNVSANGSGVAEPNFNTGGNAGTFTSVSVGIGSLANVSGLIITGYGHLSDSLSAAVLTNGFLNAGDYVYEPSGVLHDATTALEDTVYTFTCDGSVLYFDDNSFTGYTNWETIEKLRERAGCDSTLCGVG